MLRTCLLSLKRSPLSSAVIILSLSLGIGANTVIFSWLKHSLLDPLPEVRAEGLFSLETLDDTGNYVSTSWLEYLDLRERVPSLEGVVAQRNRALLLGDTAAGDRVSAEYVSGNFFDVLGVKPALGRFYRADEGRSPGDAPVVVVSHRFWRTRLGGKPDAVGQPLRLNDQSFTVIGVAPEGFQGGLNSLSYDLWVPATMARELQPGSSELTNRKSRPYLMLARLKPGATLAQAQTELDAAAKHLIATYPETNRGLGYTLLPLWRSPRGGQTMVASLATLQLFAGLILVVVCTNTASLLLAQASGRQREIGVRLALGAAPGRIIGQLLLESVTLALLAAFGGFTVALWGADLLQQIPRSLPGSVPLRFAIELDAGTVAFGGVLAVACGVLFGLAPALQLARADVLGALRGGRGALGGRSRLRDFLVGAEVAVALLMLTLAGMFLKSFGNSLAADPGFDQERVLLSALDLGGCGYNQARGQAFVDDLLQRLRAAPGVSGAAVASDVLLDLHGLATGVIDVEGKTFDPGRKILYSYASPGYFQTMGIAFRDGEDFSPLHRGDLPVDAVVNEEMVRRYWPEGSPVGRRFNVNDTVYRVAGVVANAKLAAVNEPAKPAAWLTLRSRPILMPTLHIRTEGDPRTALTAVRAAVQALDPNLPLLEVRTLEKHVSANLVMQRVPAQMLAVLGPLALALAALGLYAVIAHSLAQRTQEIGVRMALGASVRGVVWLMIWQGLRVVLFGAGVGWGLALLAGRVLQDRLVGVPLGDPVVYGAVPLLLLVVALLACWLPARHASRVDPMIALRSD